MSLAPRPLRAADLVPGNLYYSPSGQLCMLLQPAENGISRTSYLFAYITRTGKLNRDEGFALSAANAKAIAAMRPADQGQPPGYIRRGLMAKGLA